ncbi:hypothetical protein Lalb_Chr10g0096331 [Lupinus albus]|uniref:Uncharacterized protein n=1 Tax=Lupinus albus TaxID=3870 RepID=A0A6A4PUH5_LUPAL|nr:hypothetical protein Lalb_Chr10g0096331 [Lupinus albus]
MSSIRIKTKKKMGQRKESNFDFPEKRSHRKPSNIVLLRPGQVPQSSLSFSSLPEEVYTEYACSEIPHSSTLPFSAEHASSSSETMQRL